MLLSLGEKGSEGGCTSAFEIYNDGNVTESIDGDEMCPLVPVLVRV